MKKEGMEKKFGQYLASEERGEEPSIDFSYGDIRPQDSENQGVEPSERRINCFKCQHFFITWDQANPKGCRIYGFKSRELPSLVVARNSGKSCLGFKKKG